MITQLTLSPQVRSLFTQPLFKVRRQTYVVHSNMVTGNGRVSLLLDVLPVKCFTLAGCATSAGSDPALHQLLKSSLRVFSSFKFLVCSLF